MNGWSEASFIGQRSSKQQIFSRRIRRRFSSAVHNLVIDFLEINRLSLLLFKKDIDQKKNRLIRKTADKLTGNLMKDQVGIFSLVKEPKVGGKLVLKTMNRRRNLAAPLDQVGGRSRVDAHDWRVAQ